MDHGTTVLQIAGDADDGRLAVADRRPGQHVHRRLHKPFAQPPTDVEQRREVVGKTPGEGIADHRHRDDPRDRRAGFAEAVGLDGLLENHGLANLHVTPLSAGAYPSTREESMPPGLVPPLAPVSRRPSAADQSAVPPGDRDHRGARRQGRI